MSGRQPLRTALVSGALVLLLWVVWTWMSDPFTRVSAQWAWLAMTATVVCAGEFVRVEVSDLRDTAPLSIAGAIAMVATPLTGLEQDHGRALFTSLAAAILVGALARSMVRPGGGIEGPICRLLFGSLLISAYWSVPWRGANLYQWQLSHGAADRWQVALLMVCLTAPTYLAAGMVQELVAAERLGRRRLAAMRDEIREHGRFTAAAVASGIIIALAHRSLGWLSLFAFLFPLGLAVVASRRHARIRRTYREAILALSELTDQLDLTTTGHARRVAVLASELARELGCRDREVREIEYAALLHDLGQLGLREPIPGGATVLAAPNDQRTIAVDGARVALQTGVMDAEAEILQHQATGYRAVREMGEKVPLGSRILKVANAYDDFGSGAQGRSALALERIHLGLGYEYDPDVVDALQRVLDRLTGGAATG